MKMLNQSLTDIKLKDHQYSTIRVKSNTVMEKEPEKVEENPRDVYGNDTKSVESRRE